MWRILPVLYMCISLAASLQAGWHSNAWNTVSGVDTNAYADWAGLLVEDAFTQEAADGNEIQAVTLPSGFGSESRVWDYSGDGCPPDYVGITMPASTNSTRYLTNEYWAILGKGMDPADWNSTAQSWTNSVTATNSLDETYSITTTLDRSYTIYPGTNEASRAVITNQTYEAIRYTDLFLAFKERAQAAEEFYSPSGIVQFYRNDGRQQLGMFDYYAENYPYTEGVPQLITHYVVPMADYTDWFNTPSEFDWQDADGDGANDTWVLIAPTDWPYWDAVSICRSNDLPVQAFTNEVTETVYGWEVGQYDTYELTDHTYDKVTYETYFDHMSLRNLFMVQNTPGRVNTIEYRFNAFEQVGNEGVPYAWEEWTHSDRHSLMHHPYNFNPKYETPYEEKIYYTLDSSGSYSTIEEARLRLYRGESVIYDHTFTTNAWTNIAVTVTNHAIAAGHDYEDYDMAGLKAIADSLYVLPVSGALYADPLVRKYASGSVDTDDGEYWADAKSEAEASWAAASISTYEWEELDRFFPGEHYAQGRVQEIYPPSRYEYEARLSGYGLRLAITNTTDRAAYFDAYMLFDQPWPWTGGIGTELTTDAEDHGYTGNAAKLEAGRLLDPEGTWTASTWSAGGAALSAVPTWCSEPTLTPPPAESRGYTFGFRSIMKLNTPTNGFEYITIEE